VDLTKASKLVQQNIE